MKLKRKKKIKSKDPYNYKNWPLQKWPWILTLKKNIKVDGNVNLSSLTITSIITLLIFYFILIATILFIWFLIIEFFDQLFSRIIFLFFSLAEWTVPISILIFFTWIITSFKSSSGYLYLRFNQKKKTNYSVQKKRKKKSIFSKICSKNWRNNFDKANIAMQLLFFVSYIFIIFLIIYFLFLQKFFNPSLIVSFAYIFLTFRLVRSIYQLSNEIKIDINNSKKINETHRVSRDLLTIKKIQKIFLKNIRVILSLSLAVTMYYFTGFLYLAMLVWILTIFILDGWRYFFLLHVHKWWSRTNLGVKKRYKIKNINLLESMNETQKKEHLQRVEDIFILKGHMVFLFFVFILLKMAGYFNL
jgi:hypothetical protein